MRRLRRSFSLAESVLAVTVVGVMLVASLKTLGAIRVGQQKMSERTQGLLLAQELMSEILAQHYTDPDLGLGSFGLGSDEVGTGSRALWEDVDDYNGRSESPPQRKDGTAIPGLTGWGWRVSVAWVNPLNLGQTSASETSVKRITVTVSRKSVDVAALVAVRTAAGG